MTFHLKLFTELFILFMFIFTQHCIIKKNERLLTVIEKFMNI